MVVHDHAYRPSTRNSVRRHTDCGRNVLNRGARPRLRQADSGCSCCQFGLLRAETIRRAGVSDSEAGCRSNRRRDSIDHCVYNCVRRKAIQFSVCRRGPRGDGRDAVISFTRVSRAVLSGTKDLRRPSR